MILLNLHKLWYQSKKRYIIDATKPEVLIQIVKKKNILEIIYINYGLFFKVNALSSMYLLSQTTVCCRMETVYIVKPLNIHVAQSSKP